MVSVGSLPVRGNAVFDFDSQGGVMHLLASIRSSDLSTAQKSELRDLVFLYTNGGRDQTVRLALEQKISAYRVAPAPVKQSVPPPPPAPPQPTIGKYRTAPSFSVPQFTPSATPTPAPTTSIPVFTTTPAWSAPHHEEGAEEVAPVPAPVEPAPVAVVPIESAPRENIVSADTNEYLTRIREIKAAVNEKVGNPVNLVDINNEVGREYMGALLDAMKKINSGSSAGSAMKRLEDAYASVLKALEAYASTGGDTAVVSAVAPQSHPEPEPAPVSAPERAPMTTPISNAFTTQLPPLSQSEPVVNTPPEPAPEPIVNRIPIQQTYVPPAEAMTRETPLAEPLGEPAPPPPRPASAFASLADLKERPHTLNDLQTAASLKAEAVAGDPLFTKEVDAGLEQLLSEWSIFRKSGLFGTGPKGSLHPLFKKMAPLHIPLLLAGRFEGATQEIKQSITDYMNGWRYEQGLIYQQGETFEHYLRRVIRHILDLQKG